MFVIADNKISNLRNSLKSRVHNGLIAVLFIFLIVSLLSCSGGGNGGGGGSSASPTTYTHKFVYAANHDSHDVYAYSIGTDGTLTLVEGSPFTAGAFPESVTADPLGRFVYVANYGSDNISAYMIGANGSLTAVANSPFAAGDSPVSLTTVGIR